MIKILKKRTKLSNKLFLTFCAKCQIIIIAAPTTQRTSSPIIQWSSGASSIFGQVPKKETVFTCAQCGRVYKRKDDLDMHKAYCMKGKCWYCFMHTHLWYFTPGYKIMDFTWDWHLKKRSWHYSTSYLASNLIKLNLAYYYILNSFNQ